MKLYIDASCLRCFSSHEVELSRRIQRFCYTARNTFMVPSFAISRNVHTYTPLARSVPVSVYFYRLFLALLHAADASFFSSSFTEPRCVPRVPFCPWNAGRVIFEKRLPVEGLFSCQRRPARNAAVSIQKNYAWNPPPSTRRGPS